MARKGRSRSKYHNHKIVNEYGTFDSEGEFYRYLTLLRLEDAGVISNLQRQQEFILIPIQREQSTEVYKRGPKKGQYKPGKVIERACEYKADFVYQKDGQTCVEDFKGFRTKEYIIKRKLMLWVYGIQIKEVN